MAKLRLYPPSGTLDDAKSLKFEISDVNIDSLHVNMENATHGTKISITSLQNMGDGSYMGLMDVNIPNHFFQSAISIFAHLGEKKDDGTYMTIQICPTIFTIKNEIESITDKLSVFPSFVSPGDMCSIKFLGKPDSKKVVSINDKFFKTVVNSNGLGSISFKGSDVLGNKEIDSVYQLPIYLYSEEDNFTKKVFSNTYLNILPLSLSMHADPLDPRCDPDSDSYADPWVQPIECITPPVIDPPVIIEPTIPPDALPTTCKEDEVILSDDFICKIFGHDATVLNNGTVVHAYLSPKTTVSDNSDPEFNKNAVFIATHQSTLDVKVIVNRDVVVEPKVSGEIFRIHVQKDVWDSMTEADNPSGSDIYVVLFNEAIGFQRIQITGRTINEYTGGYILLGGLEDDSLETSAWLFCVNSVFYHASKGPPLNGLDPTGEEGETNIGGFGGWVRDAEFNVLQVLSVSIASNPKYVGEDEESYIYVVVDALDIYGKSQLFFASRILKDPGFAGSTSLFTQLTTDGNNWNPIVKIGPDNNLHIAWESDRAGIRQVYYGALGLSSVSSVCTAFSSCLDKYSEFLSRSDAPFDFLSANLLTEVAGDEYNPIPEDDSESLVSSSWNTFYGSGASISQSGGDNYINNVTIVANALQENAMAFNSLQIIDDEPVNNNPSINHTFSQFNYQIAFDLQAVATQGSSLATGTVINDKEMDNIFDEWKSEFILSSNSNVQGQPLYTKDGNTFIIGRSDGIFDRIVPFIGSYKVNNPSVDAFQIDITDQSNNLKDFTFGLIFEKTIFTATNISTSSNFSNDDPSISYVELETHVIYTGMAKMVALIKTEDVDSDRANYIIVREFPEKINISAENSYTIIVNYTALDSDEVTTLVDTYDQVYLDRFLGQITLLIDGIPRFSQSFISTILDDYNYFDIGLGIPYGGYYIADKMSPSKLGVFDNIESTLVFSNISITSPTFVPNADVIRISDKIRDMTSLRVWNIGEPGNPGGDAVGVNTDDLLNLTGVDITKYTLYVARGDSTSYDQLFDVMDFDKVSINFDTYGRADRIIVQDGDGTSLYDSGFGVFSDNTADASDLNFDIDVTSLNSMRIIVQLGAESRNVGWEFRANFKITYGFTQIPITFEGINQSPNMTLGTCDDVHLAWQSNRDKYWNIFYSNSVNKLSPFRFNTQITNTESNSLRPSVSVNRNGTRLITWHDDRNGNYDIFAARSTDGYACNQDKCSKEMAEAFESSIIECNIEIDYQAVAGVYSLSLEFYKDAALTDLYKTITLDEDSSSRWLIDSSSVDNILSYDSLGVIEGVIFYSSGTVTISYTPGKDDGIFDIVLYVKLIATEVTGQ